MRALQHRRHGACGATPAAKGSAVLSKLRGKLTYSNVVVTALAFVVLAGGGAYAAARIDGKDLVDRSVGGRKLVTNTVRGAEVKESTLGTVNRAKLANEAGIARNVVRLDYAGRTGSQKTILAVAGMSVLAQCAELGGSTTLAVTLTAKTGEANASYLMGLPPKGSDPYTRDSVTTHLRGKPLAPTDPQFGILPIGSDDVLSADTGFAQADGQFVWRSAARVVGATFHAFVDAGGSCEINGTASIR
jgi:hypothetical protein